MSGLGVRDVHLELPGGAAALPHAEVCILLGVENLLTLRVVDLVFVVKLPALSRYQQSVKDSI